jgi:hypothetical protein
MDTASCALPESMATGSSSEKEEEKDAHQELQHTLSCLLACIASCNVSTYWLSSPSGVIAYTEGSAPLLCNVNYSMECAIGKKAGGEASKVLGNCCHRMMDQQGNKTGAQGD